MKLSSSELQSAEENAIFGAFAEAANLKLEGQPKIEYPPKPDISCRIEGVVYFFELGEIVDSAVAKQRSDLRRYGSAEHVSFDPIGSLGYIIEKKKNRTYDGTATPVDLLLHADVLQLPHNAIEAFRPEIEKLLSKFQRVWVFDLTRREVVLKITK